MAYNGKRLHKSESDKKLCGVCGGIAEYFDILTPRWFVWPGSFFAWRAAAACWGISLRRL